jgi:Ras-related protein Rab-5C
MGASGTKSAGAEKDPVAATWADDQTSLKVVLLGSDSSGKSCLAQRFVQGDFNELTAPTIGAAFFTKTLDHKALRDFKERLAGLDFKERLDERISAPYRVSLDLLEAVDWGGGEGALEEFLRENPTKFEVWDTAGQERYDQLGPMYYRHSACCVLGFDSRSRSSFAKAQKWLDEVRRMQPETVLVLTANRYDKVEDEEEKGITNHDDGDNDGDENHLHWSEVNDYMADLNSLDAPRVPLLRTSAKRDWNVFQTFLLVKVLCHNVSNPSAAIELPESLFIPTPRTLVKSASKR